ncbi:LLM class flavin-dependent oxidoreductase [Microbacterium amylolyticum]|uniref:Alkanesulfonate monooxygenase SsuD/methylene tetrahydromethanopterin reductase-like flavin-dependent oxidoreductase (Luciferase family) n=1 Tax=Microbacterium amylolyticum TaxID=936337 RepID=A0ABS4ZFZ8_9MICO|nr:LLM class flavin-dependent oxidoreductase [Microbacterium amylolyticum]MBP2436211.1 alkanesulfonate monooxygenase SsuD/methylene tetrahydromethanopterin reductase-like flavin-dependent oxidoreductase (luciferase family) [Microbacterium amylolyticum]
MKFSLWLPAHLPWSSLFSAAHHASTARSGDASWRGLWLEDHFMDNTPEPNDGARGECLTQLTALAATIPDIRIGSMVLGNTYRHPGVVAKQAAALSDIADGRFVLGIGAGWQENEHRAFGIDYGNVPSRIRWFREALEIITRLRDEESVTFAGERYQLDRASLNPRPHAQLPVLIGGKGEKVMPKLVAAYADEWNFWSRPGEYSAKNAIFTAALEKAGRAPESLWRSTQALVFFGEGGAKKAAELTRPAIGGTAEQLVDQMSAYQDAGVDEFILPVTNLTSAAAIQDTSDRFIAEVAAHV